MLGVRDRPQQTHRDRFDPAPREGRENRTHRGFVEGRLDVTFGIDPLRHLEGVTARDVGIGIFELQVMRLGLAALFQQ